MLPVPPNAREKLNGSGFTPYIFTHDEMRLIFDAADNWKSQGASYVRCAPLLFRFLYGTGLRINEALSLTAGDISIRQEMLLVREAKNDNSRLVPMSQSLSGRVADYLSAHGYPEGAIIARVLKCGVKPDYREKRCAIPVGVRRESCAKLIRTSAIYKCSNARRGFRVEKRPNLF